MTPTKVDVMRSRKPALSEAEGDPYPQKLTPASQGISITGLIAAEDTLNKPLSFRPATEK
jgi:hypothetical protein